MSERVLVAPMSDLQRDWWFRERTFRNPDLVASGRVLITEPVDMAALARAVRRLVARHEALRTTFVAMGEETVQLIWPALPEPVLRVEDLTGLDDPDRESQLARIVDDERNHIFDLTTEPLLRVVLVRLSATESLLSLTIHHIVVDGWAYNLVWQELSAFYQAERSGVALPDDRPPMQLREWVAEERELTGDPFVQEQLEYWHRELATLPPVHLPRDRPPTNPLRFVSAEHRFDVPPSVSTALEPAALRYRATPYLLGLTAFLQLLARRTGRSRVAAITLLHRRSTPAVRGLVGCVMNAVTVNADLSSDVSTDAVAQVKKQVLTAHENQDIFVSRVWDGVPIGPGDVDALFIFDKMGPPNPTFGGHPVRDFTPAPRTYERYGPWWENLKLRLVETGSVITGIVEYNAELYYPATITGFAAEYVEVLEKLCLDID